MTRALGTLTLDLVARVGGFTKGFSQAERAANKSQREIAEKAKQRANEVKRAWVGLRKFIAGAIPVITAATVVNRFIQKSIDVQNEQGQLAAALRSTGEAAGFTQQQLNDLAAEMSGILPDTGAVNTAQTALLKYTNVVGDEYVRALRLAGDLSARTGADIAAAADIVGKALNTPSEGLARLRSLGVGFSDSQIEGLQALVDTGRAAEAQRVVLDELAKSYGGAAEAARATFGGALNALQKAFEDAVTGDGGSIDGMREGIESLIAVLKSQAFKDGFGTLLSGIAKLIEYSGKAIFVFTDMARVLGETLAKSIHGSADQIERLDETMASLRGNIENLQSGIQGRPAAFEWVRESKERIEELQKELAIAVKTRDELVRAAGATPVVPRAPDIPSAKAIDLEAVAATKKAQEEARKATENAIKAADAYVSRLEGQIASTKELTAQEMVIAELRKGAIAGPGVSRALDLAEELDLMKAQHAANEQLVKDFEDQSRAFEERASRINAGREFAQDIIISSDPIAGLQKQLEDRRSILSEYAAEDAANRTLYADAAVIAEQSTQDQITKILEDAEKTRSALRKAEQDRYLRAATTFFDDLASLQDVSSNRIARVAKAAAIANAIVKTYESANAAYASLAGIPVAGPALGAAAAAAAIAAGLANVQAIRATSNRAGGGNVSSGSAYMVGEVGPELFVPQQSGFIVPNQLIDKTSGGSQINQRIINVIDPAMVGDFMATPSGEQVLLNVIRRNADSVKAVVSNG